MLYKSIDEIQKNMYPNSVTEFNRFLNDYNNGENINNNKVAMIFGIDEIGHYLQLIQFPVINKIDNLEFSLASEIRSLESSLSDRILDMQKSTEESLGAIGTRINYGNMINTIHVIKG